MRNRKNWALGTGHWALGIVVGLGLVLPATLRAGDPPGGAAVAAAASARTVAYRGYLPYCANSAAMRFTGDYDIEFALYETPSKGVAKWRELRKGVHVVDGRISLALGEVVPIPTDLYTATFRWVGISIGGQKELTPRLPVVNTLWVHQDGAVKYAEASPPTATACGEGLVRAGDVCIESQPRPAATWADADAAARKLGRRLPTRDEWLAALKVMKARGLEDMTGHYEWTEPWLFDPTDGSTEIELYSGKINGCSFEELSPELNQFRYRLVAK